MKIKKIIVLILLQYICIIFCFSQISINNVNDAVNIALQNSKQIYLQELNSLITMKTSKLSFREFLPSVNFSYNDSSGVTYFSTDTNSKTFSVSLNQLLFDGGKLRFNYQINKLNSMYSYNAVTLELKEFQSQIINEYYSLLKQREIVNINEDLLESATEQLTIIEKEKDLGLTLETEYLEYQISYLQTENDLYISKRELRRREDDFKILLGLSKNVKLDINDSFYNDYKFISYIDYIDFLFEYSKNNNLELKQQNLSIITAQKQLEFSKTWFLPSISLEGGVSFSGTNYPLTEPSYNLKLNFSFSDNPFLPTDINKSLSLKNQKLNNITDNASFTLLPSSTYLTTLKQNKISLLQLKLQYENSINQLYDSISDAIYSLDDLLHSIIIQEKTINLQQKKIEVSKAELKTGNIKRVDYLEDLINLASYKIQLLDEKFNAQNQIRTLEIITYIPLGELENVCKNQKF